MSGMASNAAADLAPEVWGDGIDVVLVHGSISTGSECWRGQRPLAEGGFRLWIPDRRGYRDRDRGMGEDFLHDADEIAELLGEGAHLVGHSYGGIGALLAAAARPEATLSLTVIEPPAFALASGYPEVVTLIDGVKDMFTRGDLSDREFLERFLRIVGAPTDEIPQEILELWSERVAPMRSPTHRPPWEAKIPIDELRTTQFPKLLVSGGHHPAFDAVCDQLTQGLDAERVVITGAGHEVQMMADPFNDALRRVWARGRAL